MVDNFDPEIGEAFRREVQKQTEGWLSDEELRPTAVIRNDNTVALESIANSLQNISKSLDQIVQYKLYGRKEI